MTLSACLLLVGASGLLSAIMVAFVAMCVVSTPAARLRVITALCWAAVFCILLGYIGVLVALLP